MELTGYIAFGFKKIDTPVTEIETAPLRIRYNHFFPICY